MHHSEDNPTGWTHSWSTIGHVHNDNFPAENDDNINRTTDNAKILELRFDNLKSEVRGCLSRGTSGSPTESWPNMATVTTAKGARRSGTAYPVKLLEIVLTPQSAENVCRS